MSELKKRKNTVAERMKGMRKTKIICTIGPASDEDRILRDMCHAGMNVARINFSHGTYDEQQNRINRIKKIRDELNYPLPIMLV